MRTSQFQALIVPFIVSAVLVSACSSEDSDDSADVADTSDDTAMGDTGVDAEIDTTDADDDTAIEDTGEDANEDVAIDAGDDTAEDVIDDTATDTADDTSTDVVEDAIDDTTDDTSTDAVDDTSDVGDDTGDVCDRNGFVSVAEDAGTIFGAFSYIAQSTLDTPVDVMSFELVPPDGAVAPGVFVLSDANYADCANCVLITVGCNADLANCTQTFLAESGTLTIRTPNDLQDGSGEQFTGTLTDAVLIEVTLDNNFESTPVVGGEVWCIDDYAFDATIQ